MITASGDIAPGEMPAFWSSRDRAMRAPLVVWDLSGANLTNIPTHALLRDMDVFRGLAVDNVRTAFVLGNEVDYGMGRIVESYTEMQGFSGRYRPFRKLDEALTWLQTGDSDYDDFGVAFGI